MSMRYQISCIQNLKWLLVPGALLLALSVAKAQEGIGVISVPQVIQQTQYFKEQLLLVRQNEEYKKLEENGNQKIERLRELQEQKTRESDTMSEAQVNKIDTELTGLVQEIRGIQTQVEAYEQALFQASLQRLQAHMYEAVEQAIKLRSLKLLINREAAVHADPLIDITDDVAKVLNRIYLEESEKEGQTEQ
ncbi:MAG: OmpH family outer membrane protein [Gammaproteobacteria bacterium]